MGRLCKIGVRVYIVLCILALAWIPLSAAGVWGIEPDPLSGVFAVILAMPWTLWTKAWLTETSVLTNLLVLSAGMLLNAAILMGLCRWLQRFRSSD